MDTEEVQKIAKKSKNPRDKSKKKSLDLWVYEQIKAGKSPARILEQPEAENLTKQKLDYYLQKLRRQNLVKKIGYGTWEVTKELDPSAFLKEVQKNKKSKLFSGGTSDRPRSNLHALQIKIPILSGKINDKDWKVKEKLKNWIPKYTSLPELGGLELKNNNNKSLTIYAREREIRNVEEVHKLVRAILQYIGAYFSQKYHVQIDTINAEVLNNDIATEDKNAEGMRGKGEKFTYDLNKKCEKILKKDDRNAKAWIDGTPYNFSAETNDLEWKRAYLQMPFNINSLIQALPALDEYNKNLKLHIEVQNEQLKTQKEIQRMLKKL